MSFKGVRACFTGSNEPWQLLSNAGWSELGWKEEYIEVPMQWDPRGNCRECRDDPITFSSKILSEFKTASAIKRRFNYIKYDEKWNIVST